jgi:DNA repair exonuclease SbcCD ATPase subunit
LFKDYLKVNNIDGYDFDLIQKIDSEINGKIDYQVYDKYRRYSIKWIRWDNFLSYGADNYFDFTNLKDIVLLSGKPANQSGKTTFAIDLLHFLLFGKTDKAEVQSKIFNKHIPEATNVNVEGCLCIDGEDYIIKRTLSRPSLDKRTEKSKVTQKVEYYKIVAGNKEELTEYIDNQQEENSVQTNKVIKEAIGKESDFDLIMSITESNLDALIGMKETERGRVLSRLIGLLPIEEKDALARQKFNTDIKPSLISNRYNSEALKQEIESYKTLIKSKENIIAKIKKENKEVDEEITNLEKNKETLLSSKQTVDETLLNVDITTLNASIEKLTDEGVKKKADAAKHNDRIKEIGEVDFSVEKYDKLVSELSELKEKRGSLLEKHKSVKHNIEHLKNSEFCPVCKRKLDNVDNTAQIKEQEGELIKIVEEGKKVGNKISETEKLIESMKVNRELYNEKSRLTMAVAALEINISNLREQLKDKMRILKDYKKNSEAIDKNNQISIQITNNDVHLRNKRNQKEINVRNIYEAETEITNYKTGIKDREDIISKIKEEEKLIKNWNIYLELVGKNGISKMVFRKTLPIINAKLSQLLSDVCDFDVEVGINVKNDVMFYLIKDGVKSDLSSGSGFEKTAASLALRSVLAELSTIPRNAGVLMDEITARVSEENLENIHNLINKMLTNYDYVFVVSHNPTIAQNWCSSYVEVEKVNNISKISLKKK